LQTRVDAWENGEWVRDAAMAYSEKQAAKKVQKAS